MRTKLCDTFGIEFPIFAFSHCRDVVVAVSRAGGFGVLGALAFSPDQLETELCWIDEHIDGRPYGVDVVMPASYAGSDQPVVDRGMLEGMISPEHRRFVDELLARYKVPPLPEGESAFEALLAWTYASARTQVDIALGHPIRLLVNALGTPPADVIDRVHRRGVLVAALVGSVEQARRQVEAGVDVVVAQGTEAGGHTGEVATMVLVPDVVDAIHPTPVLAAGGIACGRQVAAALALGADGAWTGSVWLTTRESDLHPAAVEKLLRAGSRDTVRSRALTGKPARQLRTPWTEAWEGPESPGTLPMPLQFMLTAEAVTRIHRYAHVEESGAKELIGSPVGQVVGRMKAVRPVREVIYDMVNEFLESAERIQTTLTPPVEPLHQDVVMEFPYKHSTGEVIGRFLAGLRDQKKIWGQRVAGQGVVVPPLGYSEVDGADGGEWVEVGPRGTVAAVAVVHEPIAGLHPAEAPFAFVLVKLDGADTAMAHLVREDLERLHVGARVEAVWAPDGERRGTIRDIAGFRVTDA